MRWEIGIVLAVTVGQSALYSVLVAGARVAADDADRAAADPAQPEPGCRDPRGTSLYQFLGVVFALALVALVVYLLWEPGQNALRRMGLDFTRFGGDLGRGILLVLVIGIPGLGLYAAARRWGSPSRSSPRRWTPPGGRSRCCCSPPCAPG